MIQFKFTCYIIPIGYYKYFLKDKCVLNDEIMVILDLSKSKWHVLLSLFSMSWYTLKSACGGHKQSMIQHWHLTTTNFCSRNLMFRILEQNPLYFYTNHWRQRFKGILGVVFVEISRRSVSPLNDDYNQEFKKLYIKLMNSVLWLSI